ncbi:MAG: hypothetical protein R3B82_08700 [Sandaracinaceae bacterium]
MTSEAAFDPEAVVERLVTLGLGRTEAVAQGQAVEVRRDEAVVVVVGVDSLKSGALTPYTEKFSMGLVGNWCSSGRRPRTSSRASRSAWSSRRSPTSRRPTR